MQIDVRVDLKDAERYLKGLRKDQVPFATAYALTQTAKDSQQRIADDMRRSFDRPKPFTLNGTFVSAATKSRLEATVKLKDGYARGGGENSKRGTPDKYLRSQVQGGARRNTAFERMLIHNGLMPPGYFAIPTNLAPRDAFGNVPPGYYTRIMSQLGVGDELQRKATRPRGRSTGTTQARAAQRAAQRARWKSMTPAERQKEESRRRTESALKQARRRAQAFSKPKATPKYPIFNVYPKREKNKHLAPGIYERLTSGFGKTLRPLFIYVDKPPTYKVRLEFDRIVRETIALRLRTNFERGYALADATKR